MDTLTPAARRLAAKVKAARSLGLYAIDLTLQGADELIAESQRLAARVAELEAERETPRCGATGESFLGGTVGPCIHPVGHEGMHKAHQGDGPLPVQWGFWDGETMHPERPKSGPVPAGSVR